MSGFLSASLSLSSKPISTLGVFALGAQLCGLDRERRCVYN